MWMENSSLQHKNLRKERSEVRKTAEGTAWSCQGILVTADSWIVKMNADKCDSEAAVCTHIIMMMVIMVMMIPDKYENKAAACKHVIMMVTVIIPHKWE